jgi:hypothetical protein
MKNEYPIALAPNWLQGRQRKGGFGFNFGRGDKTQSMRTSLNVECMFSRFQMAINMPTPDGEGEFRIKTDSKVSHLANGLFEMM